MKRIWIVILLCYSAAAFSQDSILVTPQTADSLVHHFPFLINAVVAGPNYFTGGQYLFEKWVRGRIVTANNESFADSNYFFNFNKITRNLLLTNDFKKIVEIDNREFKSFDLYDERDTYRFEHVYILNNRRFFQVLVQTEKYSLYKYSATHFRKNEAARNTGEFVDSYFYYVIFPGRRTFTEIRLRKRNILKNLAPAADKVNAWFTLHDREQLDENFLVGLIRYLNN